MSPRALQCVVLACAWVTCAPAALAQPRVVVFDIEGPGGARARVSAIRVLRDHDVPIEPREPVTDALREMDGAPGAPPTQDPDALSRVARSLGIDGFVIGAVRAAGDRVVVELRVVNREGHEVGRARFEARRAADTGRVVRAGLWRELGPVIAALETGRPSAEHVGRSAVRDAQAPDPSEESAPTASERAPPRTSSAEETADDSDEVTRQGQRGDPRVDAAEYYLQAGLVMRRLRFTDDLFDALGRYDLGVAVGLGAGGAYYPLRGLVDGMGAHLGFEWAIARVLVDDTENQAGDRFDSGAWAWQTSLRYEAPVGARLRLWGGLGVGRERFQVEPAGPTTPGGPVESGVPSVRYTFLRLAAGLRVRVVAGLSLALYGGWRPVVDLGQLGNADWFPRARAHGFEAGGYVAYRLHPVFELRVIAEHRRYIADLRPSPGDARVAGGSADTWLNIQLAAVVALPSAL